MRFAKMPICLTAVFLLTTMVQLTHAVPSKATDKTYPDPARFEKDIVAFENVDKLNPAPRGAIVCTGSSTMRGWHKYITEDLAPLTVIPRGFGGSNMNDLLHYADRIVTPYAPRAVVIYEGDNDIAQGIEPETVRDTFRALVDKIHKHNPAVRIYVLSIKPSISRWALWPRMKEANRLLADECSKNKRLTFIDISSVMLDTNGQVKSDILLADGLHMNRKGYELWRDVLKPVLIKNELKYDLPKITNGNSDTSIGR